MNKQLPSKGRVKKTLYKVLSKEKWRASQSCPTLQLSKDDDNFIHLATKEQLNRIIDKFWAGNPNYVILEVDMPLTTGRLVFEANPGGTNKYYHLYEGSIPMAAVTEIH